MSLFGKPVSTFPGHASLKDRQTRMFSWLLRMPTTGARVSGQLLAGLLLCGVLAAVATLLATWGGSSVVWALLFGMAIASVRAPSARFIPGIDFTSKQVLRLGVALLGLQISSAAFHVLNFASVADLAFNVAIVLFAGWLLGPLMGIERRLALVLAGSV